MNKVVSTILGILISMLILQGQVAYAGEPDSIIINGRTWYCTNRCVITIDQKRNVVRLSDCCGGRIWTTFEP